MKMSITGRHMEVSDSLKDYIESKFDKLEKYFHQFQDAHIIMYIEKLNQVAEIVLNGDGNRFHAVEKSADMYSSIDLLYDKIEKQIKKYKEKRSGHKAVSLGKMEAPGFAGSDTHDLVMCEVSNKPIDAVEALLTMKIDNLDFILFKKGVNDVESKTDYSNQNYAVMFKSDDNLKLMEIPFKMIQKNKFDPKNFMVYNINIVDDSPVNPKIKMKKDKKSDICCMTINEAMSKIEKDNVSFLPFFNTESKYFNIIYKNGKRYELMVPTN